MWSRDVGLDLEVVEPWRPAAVVTLIEDFEFRMLGVPDLGQFIQDRGLEWHHLPIVDEHPPDQRLESKWSNSGPRLLQHLRSGQRVLVHCRGGLGRAGTIAARLLIELGEKPHAAIDRIREVRPGAIETRDQARYLLDLAVRPAEAPPPLAHTLQTRPTRSWFRDLAGFDEDTGAGGYQWTQSRFLVEGARLRSLVNGKSWDIGRLELLSVGQLRHRAQAGPRVEGVRQVRMVRGDAGHLHALPENQGALFQGASQFNLLEMTGPGVTPEAGVSGYANDNTQGLACAIAAGAATIYRNYFAPVVGQIGQRQDRQNDGLAALATELTRRLGEPKPALWSMQNGYAMFGRLRLNGCRSTWPSWGRQSLTPCGRSCESACNGAKRSRRPRRRPGSASRGPFAQRCRSATTMARVTRGRSGSRWPDWCWTPCTRPRFWRLSSMRKPAAPRRCC